MAASILCLFVVLFVHNWATRPTGRAGDRMEICLMRPGERETEGPDYKQTKHFYIFWAAMWRTFILMRCPLARFWVRRIADAGVVLLWRSGKERFLTEDQHGRNPNCNTDFRTWNLAGRVLAVDLTLRKLIDSSLGLLVVAIWLWFPTRLNCSAVSFEKLDFPQHEDSLTV